MLEGLEGDLEGVTTRLYEEGHDAAAATRLIADKEAVEARVAKLYEEVRHGIGGESNRRPFVGHVCSFGSSECLVSIVLTITAVLGGGVTAVDVVPVCRVSGTAVAMYFGRKLHALGVYLDL